MCIRGGLQLIDYELESRTFVVVARNEYAKDMLRGGWIERSRRWGGIFGAGNGEHAFRAEGMSR